MKTFPVLLVLGSTHTHSLGSAQPIVDRGAQAFNLLFRQDARVLLLESPNQRARVIAESYHNLAVRADGEFSNHASLDDGRFVVL